MPLNFSSMTRHTDPAADSYVSTGHLPPEGRVNALVAEAHERFRANTDGEVSKVYPALACMEPGLFGICVAGTGGDLFSVMNSR